MVFILEKAMTPHSSTLAWKILWLQSMGSLTDTTEQLQFHFSLSCIGEGNGNPLQCSWLENPWDGGAWWAAVYWVTQSQTLLNFISTYHFIALGKAMATHSSLLGWRIPGMEEPGGLPSMGSHRARHN